jgi:hypothetical protein
MMPMNVSGSLRVSVVVALAGFSGACSTVKSLDPAVLISSGAATQAPPGAPVAEAVEVDCPQIEVQDGTAGYRIGGQTNDSVRYEFAISNTARECHVQGNQFGTRIGVAGHLLIGPAGAPGVYSAPLRIVFRRDSDQKPEISKVYKIEADTAGGTQAPFQFVSEPIMLPFTHQQESDDYTILVGFDTGKVGAAAKPHASHLMRPARHRKHSN